MTTSGNDSLFQINTSSTIMHDKLPSKLEVLQHLFYYTRDLKKSIHDAALLVFESVSSIWNEAGIPTRDNFQCIRLIESLHTKWRSFQKSASRSKKDDDGTISYQSELEEIFDIAPVNVATTLLDETRLSFLNNQRLPGRVGTITDLKILLQNNQSDTTSQAQSAPSEKNPLDFKDLSLSLDESVQDSQEISSEDVAPASQNLGSEYVLSQNTKNSDSSSEASPPMKKKRGKKEIMTEKLVAVLDKSKISSRNSVRLIAAVLEAAELDVEDFIISRTALQVRRNEIRQQMFVKIKEEFKLNKFDNLIVHWDGKLLPQITGNDKVDRVPIILTSNNMTKLLCVSKLEDGHGRTQAEAVFEALTEWGIADSVKGVCCDTTPSNLGRINGAATLLEQLLERNVFYFPCRHHILELILRSAFEELLPGTVGPNVQIFNRFRSDWPNLGKTAWESGLSDPVVASVIQNDLETIEKMARYHLSFNFEREDYKELLCLIMLFIGEKPTDNYVIRPPGAMHHARWMAKAVYTLKIFLLREIFHLSKTELLALQQISIFIVKVYFRYWFITEIPEKAPTSDFELLKECHRYKLINEKISKATLKKITNHLWYLIPENAAMAFFDDDVPTDVKKKMVLRLNVYDENELKKLALQQSISEIIKDDVSQFVTQKSLNFFKEFNFNFDWLKEDPDSWNLDCNYQNCKKIVKSLKVVNDVAERNIKLFEEYNGLLTKDENQQQFIMHCLELYHKEHPSIKKSDL